MMPKTISAQGATYSLLFCLKQSPSKQVYKALKKDKHTHLEQEVLLKVFAPEDKTYKGELETLLRVNSPYCVQLLGFESFSKKRALVLTYIHGVCLHELQDAFPLSDKEIETLLASIHQGLLDLRKQGLCHGDLSLDNVLLDQKGQIKFIDFGKGNYQEHLQGTLPFVAPEILKGRQPDFYSDLFSLGVLEMSFKQPAQFHELSLKNHTNILNASGLLASDPLKRSCSFQVCAKAQKSLASKVSFLLSRKQRQKTSTQELNASESSTLFQKIQPLKQLFLVLGFGLLVGPASFSDLHPSQGFLKVITHKWFFVDLKNIKQYAPVQTALSPGWHLLTWKSATKKGVKLIHIKTGQTLLLNDKDFYPHE